MTCALTCPPNSWRMSFKELPSTPSIASTSDTNAAFSLIDNPGARSIPKWSCRTSTMLSGGSTLTSA